MPAHQGVQRYQRIEFQQRFAPYDLSLPSKQRPLGIREPDAFSRERLLQVPVPRLEKLDDDQVMAMKTTFTPGHYRRRVAGVLARRLVTKLFEG